MNRTLIVAAAVALATGCGAGAATDQPTTSTSKPAASPAPKPSKDPACKAVSAKLGSQIASRTDGGKWVEGQAVKSAEHAGAYYVAGKLKVGADEVVGVWASNEVDGTGVIQSVDGIASQFTDYPQATEFSVTDAGADAAKACLG